jgi:hypothetical protein
MSAEMANEIKLISGRSHPELSDKIAKRYVEQSDPRAVHGFNDNSQNEALLTCLSLLQARYRGRPDNLPELLQPRDLLHGRRVGPRRGCLHRAVYRHGRR